MTEQELLNQVPAEKKEEAKALLHSRSLSVHIGIQIILFVGAFLSSAVCVLGTWLIVGMDSMLLWGLCWTGFGYWLLRLGKQHGDIAYVFVEYLGLILSIGGRAVILILLTENISNPVVEALCVTAVAAISYPFFTHKLDRFIFSAISLFVWTEVLHEERLVSNSYFGFISLVLVSASGWFFAARKVVLRPLAYALLGVGLGNCIPGMPGEIWHGLVRVLAAGSVAFGISRLPVKFVEKLFLCLLTAVLACCLNSLAFLGIVVCVAGYLLREKIAEWLGMAAFCAGLWFLYFSLSGTLLYKSGCLVGSGLVVLALYAYMRRKYAR